MRIALDSAQNITAIHGDPANPLTRGYACIKGLTLAEAHRSPERFLHPLKREPDGSFKPIAMADALDEIAVIVARTIGEHGPDAVAGFRGTMNYTNSLANHMLPAWLAAMGSHSFFSTMTIDQSAKWITADRLGSWDAAPVIVQSEHGEVSARVTADPTLRPGVVTLTHGWGDRHGANVNRLTSNEIRREAINAMPVLSGFAVRVTAARPAEARQGQGALPPGPPLGSADPKPHYLEPRTTAVVRGSR